jgi:hypothetical protein
MTLINIVGDVRTGKTLFATYLAKIEKRPVFSNYKIDLPNYKHLTPELLFNINFASLSLIDEAYAWLESRTSGRDINKYMSYILFQSGKRGIDIVLTDQLESTIDIRYRRMVNFEVHTEKVSDGFIYRIFKINRYKGYKLRTFFMSYEFATTIFPLYETLEIINAIDEDLIFDVTEDKSTILEIVDKCTSELLKKASASVYTKGIVANYCLRKNLSQRYVNLIYHSIKSSNISIE